MNASTKKLFVTAAVAGILGGLNATAMAQGKAKAAAKTAEVMGTCTQSNTCKNLGGCGEMKGKNTCSGHVIKDITEAKCKTLQGTFVANTK